MRLINNIDAVDVLVLMNANQLYESLYVFNVENKEIIKPTPIEVPWPIAWLFGAHSRKHIAFEPKPDIKILNDEIRSFVKIRPI